MKPIYLIADTHFNHYKLVEVFKERPSDFEKRIIKGLQALPSDCTLIHLGDLSMDSRDLGQLKWNTATKHIKNRILILGNHDKSANWFYERDWNFVCDQFILKLFGHNILFSHVPQDRKQFPMTTVNIHAHTHGNTHRDEEVADIYDPDYHIEIAIENSSYQPVLLNDKLFKSSPHQKQRGQ